MCLITDMVLPNLTNKETISASWKDSITWGVIVSTRKNRGGVPLNHARLE